LNSKTAPPVLKPRQIAKQWFGQNGFDPESEVLQKENIDQMFQDVSTMSLSSIIFVNVNFKESNGFVQTLVWVFVKGQYSVQTFHLAFSKGILVPSADIFINRGFETWPNLHSYKNNLIKR